MSHQITERKMGKIQTMWSIEVIARLRERQQDQTKHPYTCGGLGPEDRCHRIQGIDEGVLVPTAEGFVCPCGSYRQVILLSVDRHLVEV